VIFGEERSLRLIMGMTIDDSISHLSGILTEATEFTNSICYVTEDDAETLQVAIETMRKYQKIQEIINNAKDSDGAVKYNWLYEQITEEVEDGKID
jgi:hypothetical protein